MALKDLVLTDLKGALAMVGQAQERCTRKEQPELFVELGKLYDNVDDMIEALNDGLYDKGAL